jgi:diadenosine tetraphosphatase ApaH/serine/threonine PP2A family protein phosphatase
MRIALLSDIHSNYEAFSAVAADLASQNVGGICILGDIIGYGADPSPVLSGVMAMFGHGDSMLPREFAALAGLGKAMVLGNHDAAAVKADIVHCFNPRARAVTEWTKERLVEEEIRFLSALPLTAEVEGAALFHSSPEAPADFSYILGAADARIALENSDNGLVFIGHTHRPAIYEFSGEMRTLELNEDVNIRAGARYIVNVGSVGQPRDRDNRAAYLLWDTERNTLRLKRVEYDIEAAANKIIAAGLPKELGERLYIGR